MIFDHTYFEPDRKAWRGWFKNGRSLEITWLWTSVGLKYMTFSNENDRLDHTLWVGLGFIQFYIPLRTTDEEYPVGDEPSWGIDVSREWLAYAEWGERSTFIYWPFRKICLSREFETADGWMDVMSRFQPDNTEEPVEHVAPYTYTLRSGEVQRVNATVTKVRRITGRHALHRLGWPKRTTYELDIMFDGEVGEEAGSWKGGTIGCGWDMLPGEDPVDALRRMEATRRFER